MLNILWNNWWIWSHWYFYAKTCATTKISTVVGYHVVLATLLFILKKKINIFKGFYHIRKWRPSWSCDLDRLNKRSFPHPMEAPYESWLWLAKRFLRRRCLKTVDDRPRTTDVYLSLAHQWAFGSGKLKCCILNLISVNPNVQRGDNSPNKVDSI